MKIKKIERKNEIGLCNLMAICAGRVRPSNYAQAAYYALKIVDNVIDIMEYPFASLETTARARRSAGIGITNLAYDMAQRGLKYDSQAGKDYMHRLAEMHSYWLHEASLEIAKEKGNAPWIHKTKYPEGWLPIIPIASMWIILQIRNFNLIGKICAIVLLQMEESVILFLRGIVTGKQIGRAHV